VAKTEGEQIEFKPQQAFQKIKVNVKGEDVLVHVVLVPYIEYPQESTQWVL